MIIDDVHDHLHVWMIIFRFSARFIPWQQRRFGEDCMELRLIIGSFGCRLTEHLPFF